MQRRAELERARYADPDYRARRTKQMREYQQRLRQARGGQVATP